MDELKRDFTIVIVTHNMQQAARVSDRTAFFTAEVDDEGRRVGRLVEFDVTEKIFTAPSRPAHRGLHHRAVRLSSASPQRRGADRASVEAGAGPTRSKQPTRRSDATGLLAALDESAPRRRRRRRRRRRGVPQRRGRAVPRRAARRRARRRRDQRAARPAPAHGERVRAGAAAVRPAPRGRCQLPAVPLARTERCARCRRRSSATSRRSHRVESVRRDFVANVSHELKTPIGALGLLAETMAAGGRPGRDATARRAHGARRPSGSARIVDDLLDLSLIEAQERRAASRCRSTCWSTRRSTRCVPRPTAAGIPLAGRTPSSPDAAVACDRRQVVSAIANLLDNAVKYSEPASPVDGRHGGRRTTRSTIAVTRPRHRDPEP